MPPRKNKKKLEEEEDKLFEKSTKKQQATSKWLQVLEESQQQQQEVEQVVEKKTPAFDFSHEQEYLKAEEQRLKRKEELLRMIEEADEEVIDPNLLENKQSDEEKAERLRKEEIIKQRKKMKKERQRELRRMQVEEFEKEKQLIRQEELKQEKASGAPPKGFNWATIVYIGLAIGLFYMFYQGQMYQRLSRFRVAGQDLYSTLEADSGLTDTELKAKYKKLVLKYHPDKNRQCHDCKDKFAKIVSAWEVLGNSEKRKEYDASNGVVTKIKSTSTTLTPQNYHHLVEESGDLWIIQVYDQTSDYCHSYAPIWEEVVQMYKGFVRFGRIDAWHQQDMLPYVPYSFTFYPSMYSMHQGTSDLYAFDLRNPLGSLKQFVDSQIKARATEITEAEFDIDSTMTDGKIVLVLPTERRLLPHQARAIGQHYESKLKLYKVNPKTNPSFLSRIQLDNKVRLYFSPGKFEDIEMPHSNEDYLSIDKRISKAVIREMTICRMTDACSDVVCLLVLNPSNAGQISNRHYPRIIIRDPEFYTELDKMKKETNQVENFDLGLYMDGKIALGYVEDVEDITLDEGELLELTCWAPINITWWKVILGLALFYAATVIQAKEWKLVVFVLGAILISELTKYMELLYR